MDIYKLSLEEKYKPKVYGLGEIYEQISVERQRKRLRDEFGAGTLFLCPNKNHSGRGWELEELITVVRKKGYQVLVSGFVDSPPWQSSPSKQKALKLPPFLAKIIFNCLVFLEPFWQGEKNSHMIYALGRKR